MFISTSYALKLGPYIYILIWPPHKPDMGTHEAICIFTDGGDAPTTMHKLLMQ